MVINDHPLLQMTMRSHHIQETQINAEKSVAMCVSERSSGSDFSATTA